MTTTLFFVCATQIAGNGNNTNLTIYDVSKDTIEKKNSNRIDRLKAIYSFRYGIGDINTPSLCIQQYQTLPLLRIFDGEIGDTLREIGWISTEQLSGIESLPDVSGDGRGDLALSNEYDFSSAVIKYRFRILTMKDTASSASAGQGGYQEFSIRTMSSMPVSRDKIIQLKANITQPGMYVFCLYDITGKKVNHKTHEFQVSGEQLLSINLREFQLSRGVYTLRLEYQRHITQCTIIIE